MRAARSLLARIAEREVEQAAATWLDPPPPVRASLADRRDFLERLQAQLVEVTERPVERDDGNGCLVVDVDPFRRDTG